MAEITLNVYSVHRVLDDGGVVYPWGYNDNTAFRYTHLFCAVENSASAGADNNFVEIVLMDGYDSCYPIDYKAHENHLLKNSTNLSFVQA